MTTSRGPLVSQQFLHQIFDSLGRGVSIGFKPDQREAFHQRGAAKRNQARRSETGVIVHPILPNSRIVTTKP